MITFITVVLAAIIFELGVGAAERFSGVKWDRRRTNHLGMGLDAAGNGVTRLYSLSRRNTLTRR
jgi:hypothetical protein